MESGQKKVKTSPTTPARVTDMKNALLLSLGVGALSSFVSTGYDSFEECVLREEQKGGSRYAAGSYCRAEYPSERAPTGNPFIDGTSEQQSFQWDRIVTSVKELVILFGRGLVGVFVWGFWHEAKRERRKEKRRRERREE